MHFVRDMSFGRDMRCARWKKEANRISLRPQSCKATRSNITFAEQKYHAEPCEAYHFSTITARQNTVRCNTLYLAGKACEKEYEQNCPYSFFFVRQFKICFMVGTLPVSSFFAAVSWSRQQKQICLFLTKLPRPEPLTIIGFGGMIILYLYYLPRTP